MQNSDLKVRVRRTIEKHFPNRDDLYKLWDDGKVRELKKALQAERPEHKDPDENTIPKGRHAPQALEFIIDSYLDEGKESS